MQKIAAQSWDVPQHNHPRGAPIAPPDARLCARWRGNTARGMLTHE